MNLAFFKTDEIEVQDGVTVTVRDMTAGEREEFLALNGDDDAGRERQRTGAVLPHIVAWCACDAQGEPAWTLEEARALPARIVDEISQCALELSELWKENVEEAKGNSEAGPSSDS